jgi:TonB family protein
MTPLAQAISRALIHFLWQGLMIAVFLWIALFLLRKRSADSRYLAACMALAAMAAMPFVTAWILYAQPASGPAVILPIETASRSAAGPPALDADPRDWLEAVQIWALPIWSAGAFLFSIRLALGCKHAFTLARRGKPASSPVVETVLRLARAMDVRLRVRVLISSISDTPSVVGWLRPVILLPAGALIGLTPLQLEAVLAHEIGHIRRYDYLINLLQMVVETLLFYHPAVWWASKRIRTERELCCDDLAVRFSGNALRYARALTILEKLRLQPPSVAMASTGGPLMYRIQRLMGMTSRQYGSSRLPFILAITLGALCLAFNITWVRGQDAPGVRVDLGSSSIIHRAPVSYPESVKKQGVTGTVQLEVSLDESGNVYDAHVLSGPDELRKSALESVLNWHFSNSAARTTRVVSISFSNETTHVRIDEPQTRTEGINVLTERAFEARIVGQSEREAEFQKERQLFVGVVGEPNRGQQLEREIQSLRRQREEATRNGATASELEGLENAINATQKEFEALRASRVATGRTLTAITFSGLSDSAQTELLSRLPVRIGDILSGGSVEAVTRAVRDYDGHLLPQFLPAGERQTELRITVSNESRTR